MHINDLVIRTLEHVIDAVPYLQAVVSAGSARPSWSTARYERLAGPWPVGGPAARRRPGRERARSEPDGPNPTA
ncbi:hypothetical protein ACIGXG_31035 [Streptomyces goshikiensis]|uniref:hypothetical protein n=1 Tax=Streptomyces goshikiensis TaxID=1942 RepID=UPI0037CFF92B